MAYYCETGKYQSIYYEGDSEHMSINLLFKQEHDACAFQNALADFKFTHPTFGQHITVNKDVKEVFLGDQSSRVFYVDYDSSANADSPALSLADIKHVLSSGSDSSVPYDPLKALQSLEDITILPGTKYYWCHLVSRKEKDVKSNPNNCIWGSWIFHQYFDALCVQEVGVPLIAVRYVSTSRRAEDLPAGDKVVSRHKVSVEVVFNDSDVGRNASLLFQSFMKHGTRQKSDVIYESFLFPPNPDEMAEFLGIKYEATMKAWQEPYNM
jgi:hypothetical protein